MWPFGKSKKVEAVLFSPLEGQLTLNGKPAANAKIKLWYAWEDKKGSTFHYIADENGFFKIPKHSAMYKPFFLAQLVISQEITVEFEELTYQIWQGSKQNPSEFAELGLQPKNIVCEMTNEQAIVRGVSSIAATTCKWDPSNR